MVGHLWGIALKNWLFVWRVCVVVIPDGFLINVMFYVVLCSKNDILACWLSVESHLSDEKCQRQHARQFDGQYWLKINTVGCISAYFINHLPVQQIVAAADTMDYATLLGTSTLLEEKENHLTKRSRNWGATSWPSRITHTVIITVTEARQERTWTTVRSV